MLLDRVEFLFGLSFLSAWLYDRTGPDHFWAGFLLGMAVSALCKAIATVIARRTMGDWGD